MSWIDGEYMPAQKRANESKARLIKAGLALFSERGYQTTSITDLTQQAEMATGSFYRYFKDKKALFLAVWRQVEQDVSAQLVDRHAALQANAAPAATVLEEIVTLGLDLHTPHKDFMREVMVMAALDPDVATRSAEREDRIRKLVFTILDSQKHALATPDIEAAAELLYITVEGVAHATILHDSPIGEDRLKTATIDMLKAYLLKP